MHVGFESEPREQIRTNWEDKGRPGDLGGKVDHQLGKEESFTLNGLTRTFKAIATKGPN